MEAGLTYEDVIDCALDHFPEAEVKDLYRAWQTEALAKLGPASKPLAKRRPRM